MRRTLVKQGPSTLTLSMPKDWIDRCGLKNGDEVNLEEIETKLVISSSKKVETETIEFDFTDLPENTIRGIIIGMYKSGLRDITIKNVNAKQLIKIKEIVSNSAGWEIIDSSKNSLRIIDIGMAEEETLIKAENQTYWKLINLIEKVVEGKSSQEEIFLLDMEINRLSFFIQRNLSSKFSASTETFLRYEKVSILEELGDAVRIYNKHSSRNKEEINLLNDIGTLIEDIRIFENKKEISYLENIKQEIEKIKGKIKINDKKSGMSRAFLKEILNKVASLHENLVALNIKKLAFSQPTNK